MKKNIKLGIGLLTVLATPLAVNAVDGHEAQAATTGWVQSGNAWYYVNKEGLAVKNTWVGNYWLGSDGKMATNAWVDNGRYYVGANGAKEKEATTDKKEEKETTSAVNKKEEKETATATNKKEEKEEAKKVGWKKENNSWYYYDKAGNPVTNAWSGSYYLKKDGKMATSEWVYDTNKKAWYYVKADGSYVTNDWQGNYWLGADGKMATNAWVDNGRYYVGANGAKEKEKAPEKNSWTKEGSAWYYYDDKGEKVKGRWQGDYYLKADGKMASNEWLYDKNYKAWYYLQVDGSYAANKWIKNYWLTEDGRMATNAWVDNGRYYVGENGAKVEGAKKPEKNSWVKEGNSWYYYDNNGERVKGRWQGDYYLKADGKMALNEWFYDNNYKAHYYLQADGSYAANRWVGEYWVGADGKMATNTWVDNNRYYVGADGKWVKDARRSDNSQRLIFLDPGHGGSDPGAGSNGLREKDLTLSIYNKVNSKLAAKGYSVLSSRTNDKSVDLVSRAVQATNAKADMLLSIHFNSGGAGRASGIET